MNEIKFACPHCGQHIACDSSYAEIGIECPSCNGPLVVPRLSGNTTEAGGMVLVASSSAPATRPTQYIPPFTNASEPFWTGRIADVPKENPVMTTAWVACLFATFVLAFVLASKGLGMQALLSCVLVGGALTGYLRARGSSRPTSEALLSGIVFAVALVIVTPVLLVGILFIGCAACSR
ncbi:MAG: hypothetical protein RLY20_702 [Verrucomicrobiota bacterium]|jgi:hypothetical protein